MRDPISIAFVALTDAAPLIVAQEMGFASEEGLELDLKRTPSWSTVRDMLAFGHVEAAHMLAPLPIAMALGIGSVSADISALMVLSVNGTVIGLGQPLANALEAAGHPFDFKDASAAGLAMVTQVQSGLRIGVPFPFSMHAELLYYWLRGCGLPAPGAVEIRTVPPPLMAEALAAGEIDAFCVGEPWGSKIVERGIGTLLLPGSAIWSFAPEKVLAVRSEWASAQPDLTGRLMRAVWKANRWLGSAGAQTTAAELLARPEYLDLTPEITDRALSGRFVVRPRGNIRRAPDFMEFFDGAATFPWRSQAAWIGWQMAARFGMDPAGASARAQTVFRSDLYRTHLTRVGAVLPSASSKLEGAMQEDTAVASAMGRLILRKNWFFDGQIFDPIVGF